MAEWKDFDCLVKRVDVFLKLKADLEFLSTREKDLKAKFITILNKIYLIFNLRTKTD
jgi:hypothetical protein